MKTLLLMRHGEAGNSRAGDKARPLTERGQQQARTVGHAIAERFPRPDVILSSSAERTITTTQLVNEVLCLTSEDIHYEDDLYLASPSTIRKYAGKTSVGCLLMVGHNPGIEELIFQMATDVKSGFYGMGTACLVRLDWEDECYLDAQSAVMSDFICP